MLSENRGVSFENAPLEAKHPFKINIRTPVGHILEVISPRICIWSFPTLLYYWELFYYLSLSLYLTVGLAIIPDIITGIKSHHIYLPMLISKSKVWQLWTALVCLAYKESSVYVDKEVQKAKLNKYRSDTKYAKAYFLRPLLICRTLSLYHAHALIIRLWKAYA